MICNSACSSVRHWRLLLNRTAIVVTCVRRSTYLRLRSRVGGWAVGFVRFACKRLYDVMWMCARLSTDVHGCERLLECVCVLLNDHEAVYVCFSVSACVYVRVRVLLLGRV